ncbi:hypothetical protein BH24ACT8_BH24ACT8_24860 [soil metagenome]
MHPIDDHPLGIGELSRTSGLSVSALRFYDREGVLAPAEEPRSSFRGPQQNGSAGAFSAALR